MTCIADYHDTMQQHKATSELHLIPLEQQRTYCVGTPGEPGLPPDDRFARYANSSYNLKCVAYRRSTRPFQLVPDCGEALCVFLFCRSCMNHTTGSWEMTEPLVRFLMKHL